MNAESVKARLKNLTDKSGKTFQEELIYYGLERTIYRLSKSNYADRFVLKGGIFLYAIFGGEFVRATSDIDLLAQRLSNDTEIIKKIFSEIFSIGADDALDFDLTTLNVNAIAEFKGDYHGMNVSITGYLDRTRVPISIDIGFGDVVIPSKVIMDFPVILDMDVPKVYAYSVTSAIAEKLEALVSLGFLNSRYKDFYDIYILAGKYEMDGAILAESVAETFEHRGTHFDHIAAFEDEFSQDELHQKRWRAFTKKKKVMVPVEFTDAISRIKKLVLPVIESIKNGESVNKRWNPATERWENKQ